MSDNGYELRKILSELQAQTRILREIRDNVSNVESAVMETAPQ